MYLYGNNHMCGNAELGLWSCEMGRVCCCHNPIQCCQIWYSNSKSGHIFVVAIYSKVHCFQLLWLYQNIIASPYHTDVLNASNWGILFYDNKYINSSDLGASLTWGHCFSVSSSLLGVVLRQCQSVGFFSQKVAPFFLRHCVAGRYGNLNCCISRLIRRTFFFPEKCPQNHPAS